MSVLLDAGPSERGWSFFEAASRCMRLWAWKNLGSMERHTSDALVKGSLFHIGLAHHYQLKLTPDADLLQPEQAIYALAEKEGGDLWSKHAEKIVEAVDAYIEHYKECSWKVIAVEKELRARIPPKGRSGVSAFLYTQRVDLIVEDVHGKVWLVDHKSCYRITGKTLRQHILSGQFLGYQVFGQKMYGDRFAGVIVNRMKLSSAYDFDRCALEPAPSAVAGFVPMLRTIEKKIQDHSHLTDPLEYTPVFSDQVCFGKYGQCPAFDLCRWGGE